jgi:hypothetical protein
MVKKDELAARDYFLDCPAFGEKRVPSHAFDFGDIHTVLLHLKKVGSTICDNNPDNYGVYLGHHADGYVVGIKNIIGDALTGCEVFSTQEDMKTIWQLD